MILLIAAAALGMGGIVAYLAREKGRSPVTWAIYGTLAAPIALPHILIVNPANDDDDDVWAEIRHAIQTQSVNDQRPIVGKGGKRPMADPQDRPEPPAMQRGEAPQSKVPAQTLAQHLGRLDAHAAATASPGLNPAPKLDIKIDAIPGAAAGPKLEPKHNMFADKRHSPEPTQRAEPSFGPASAAGPSTQAANDFVLSASDRIGAPHSAAPSVHSGDLRARAPLSVDPNAQRAENRSMAGRLFAAGAVAVCAVAAIFVFGPTLARLVPAEYAFWSKPQVQDVRNAAPAAMTPSAALPGAAPGAIPGALPGSDLLPGGNTGQGEARDVGTAKFGGPIKSDPKAPAYQGSGAAPVDLAAATRGMKPVEVPDEPKKETSEAPKAEPKTTAKAPTKATSPQEAKAPAPRAAKAEPKAETKSAAVTPAPKTEAPKKAEAPKAAAPAKSEPAKAEASKAPIAPKAAAKAAPQEDFLSMVNKAIGTSSAPKPAPATSDADAIEQISEANDMVRSIQVRLRERGFDPGAIDGRTNPKTVQAIREYQQSVGLPADGLVDVALMERLGVVGRRLQFPGN